MIVAQQEKAAAEVEAEQLNREDDLEHPFLLTRSAGRSTAPTASRSMVPNFCVWMWVRRRNQKAPDRLAAAGATLMAHQHPNIRPEHIAASRRYLLAEHLAKLLNGCVVDDDPVGAKLAPQRAGAAPWNALPVYLLVSMPPAEPYQAHVAGGLLLHQK